MLIKPYGDTLNDGAVQISFTLPIKCGGKAKEAARLFTLNMGFKECEIVSAAPLSDDFTFFVAYAKTDAFLDYDQVEYAEAIDENYMSMAQTDEFIKTTFRRKITIIGACTGSDAHTVGIDAIMNMKGYNHHFGLERYQMINAVNLGAQVPNEKLIDYALQNNADAILVSQIVTQKDIHIRNLTELVELLEASKLRDKFVVVIGGPRINNKLALELGYDAGFGQGTYADHVATYIARKLKDRLGVKQ